MKTVPCLRITGLSAADQRAYVIADNKLALAARWDHRLLMGQFEALQTEMPEVDLSSQPCASLPSD